MKILDVEVYNILACDELIKTYSKIPEYYVTSYGRIYSTKTKKFLKIRVNKYGYGRVSLYNKLNIPVDHLVHRLVAEMFIINDNNYEEVNHLDNNRLNNKVDNLEWCDRLHNIRHCIKSGNFYIPHVSGEDHPDAKIDNRIVIKIRKLKSLGYTNRQLADKFNLNIKHIGKIVRREIWRHI